MGQIREDVEGENEDHSFTHLPSPRESNMVGSLIHQLGEHSPRHRAPLQFSQQPSPANFHPPNHPFWKGEWRASPKEGVLSPTNRVQVTSPTPIKRLSSLTKQAPMSPVERGSPQPVIRVLWAGARGDKL